MHGDVSPKNILVGPHGPVLLDAECAWWGDPAFDLAFCLNHLLLKCLWTPGGDARASSPASTRWRTPICARRRLGAARRRSSARAAALLPGLLLARVDGKSPVEYIADDAARERVRRVARALLRAPAPRLARSGRPGSDWSIRA